MTKYLFTIIFLIHGAWIAAQAQYANNVVVETLLKTDTTSIGQRLAYPQVDRLEVSMLKITIAPGSRTGLHKHQIPLFAYIMQGELTVVSANREPMIFRAGDAVAEMLDVYHEGINRGNEDVILIACYLGGDNKPLAEIKHTPIQTTDH